MIALPFSTYLSHNTRRVFSCHSQRENTRIWLAKIDLCLHIMTFIWQNYDKLTLASDLLLNPDLWFIRILLSTRLNNNVSVNVRNWQIWDVNCQLNFPFTWEYSMSQYFIDLRAIRVQHYNSSVFHTMQYSAL